MHGSCQATLNHHTLPKPLWPMPESALAHASPGRRSQGKMGYQARQPDNVIGETRLRLQAPQAWQALVAKCRELAP